MSAAKQFEGLLSEDQVCWLVRMPLRMLREVSRLANLGVELSGTRFYHPVEVDILREILDAHHKTSVQETT